MIDSIKGEAWESNTKTKNGYSIHVRFSKTHAPEDPYEDIEKIEINKWETEKFYEGICESFCTAIDDFGIPQIGSYVSNSECWNKVLNVDIDTEVKIISFIIHMEG